MGYDFNKRINKLKHSGNKKFKSIHYQMNYLLQKFESEKNHKGYYPKFNQGDIIFVDFGLNINHEFSNSHFAIVMNNNDTNKEDIINVVPLSSKFNDKYLKIDIDLRLEYVFNAIKVLDDSNKDYTKMLEELKQFNPDTTPSDKLPEEFQKFLDYQEDIKPKLNNLEKRRKSIEDAFSKLNKLQGDSYACTNSFQPISKFRIKDIYPKEISKINVDQITLLMIINDINLKLLSLPKIN